MRSVGLLVAVLLSTACTMSPRGFDRGALTRAARVEAKEVTEADIARALELRPQLTFPFRLAVWFRPPRVEHEWREEHLRWRDENRETVLGALRPLAAEGIVSEVVAITDSTIVGDDLRAARLAAARHGADALLVVGGASDVDRYSNPASVLYATIVGLWIVPGSRADGIFLATASLWDVRNEFLYATAEVEETSGKTRPFALLEEDEVVAVARRNAMGSIAKELANRVRSLREAPTAAAWAR
jgi:hypothetical protein